MSSEDVAVDLLNHLDMLSLNQVRSLLTAEYVIPSENRSERFANLMDRLEARLEFMTNDLIMLGLVTAQDQAGRALHRVLMAEKQHFEG